MISIIIKCCNDFRVFDCIRSIKNNNFDDAEIVVSLTPNSKIQKKLESEGIKYCISPVRKMAITTNNGIKLAFNDKVIIIDSDTVFSPNAIKYIFSALNKYQMVKPKLVFLGDSRIKYSQVIANLRNHFNQDPKKMYTPGIAFNKKIKKLIGGYYFDEKLDRAEDSEFSQRVNNANLKTSLVKNAILYHPPVDIRHDLSAAYLMGSRKVKKYSPKKFIIKRFKFFSAVLRTYDIFTLAYSFLWYMMFDIGLLSRKYKFIRKIFEDYSWKIVLQK